jgi:thiamine-monophosphate kinase
MGAYPAFALINLTIENPTKEYIENIVDGYNSVFKNYPVSIIGGDTTFGPTSLTMTLIGYSNNDNFMPTSNAKVGDIILVSGYIGESLALKKEKKYNLPIAEMSWEKFFLSTQIVVQTCQTEYSLL